MRAPRPQTTSGRSSLSGIIVRSTNLQFFLARADQAREYDENYGAKCGAELRSTIRTVCFSAAYRRFKSLPRMPLPAESIILETAVRSRNDLTLRLVIRML